MADLKMFNKPGWSDNMGIRLRGFWWKNILCTLLAVIVVTGSAPLPAFAQTSFTFISRGFGHGVGMSQFGARGFAEAGYGYVQILRHYYGSGGTDPLTAVSTVSSEPSRDVNLDRAANYDPSGNDGFTRSRWTLRPGHVGSQLAVHNSGVTTTVPDGWWSFEASGSNIIFRNSVGTVVRTFTGPVAVWGPGTPWLTQVREGTGQYNHPFVRFRGELRLTASGGRIKLINRVNMSEYLYGVVPREMPASWHMEALKAQAVAARSYSWTSGSSELYTTTEDQVYGGHSRGENRARGVTAHENLRSNSAVDATRGRVVTYGGSTKAHIARTFYMSTSGGHTENSENVWVSRLPYLRGVPDPYEVNARSTRHSWTRQTFTAAEVRDELLRAGATRAEVPTPLVGIEVTARGVSGRPTRVVFRSPTASGVFDTPAEVRRFRNAFEWGDHWFYVNPKTVRIAGPDRFATAVVASTRVFTPQAGSNPANAAIIVNGHAVADMLAASSLAGAVGGAPILMVASESVPASTAAEIKRLGEPEVIIVGGTGVVSPLVERELDSINGAKRVNRFGGEDRFATARAVALEVHRLAPASRVIAVSGESMADGIAAAGLAYAEDLPIVLVRSGSIPPASMQALGAIKPRETLVIGGDKVVRPDLMASLPGAKRIAAGANRFETAALLASYLVENERFNTGSVYVASGDTLVDALALGPLTGHNRNPLLFARPYQLSEATRAEMARVGTGIHRVFIVGGEGALSGWIQGQIEQVLE